LKVVEELLKVVNAAICNLYFKIAAFCFIEINTSNFLKELVLVPPSGDRGLYLITKGYLS
jgi:hypothetical protein